MGIRLEISYLLRQQENTFLSGYTYLYQVGTGTDPSAGCPASRSAGPSRADGLRPGLQPGLAVGGDVVGGDGHRLVGGGAELLDLLTQHGVGADRVHVHVLGDGALDVGRQHPRQEGLGALGVGGPGEDAGVLDLADGRGGQRGGGGGRAVRGQGRGGRGGVGHDDRVGAALPAAGEVGVVGVGPALVDPHAVGGELLPVVVEAAGPRRAEVRDGGQQEGQAGGGSRGVDGDEPVLVLGPGQVLEGGGRGGAVVREPGGVDVDADLAEVDGGQRRGAVDDVLVGALGQVDGGGGVEDPLVQDAGGEGVVHAEEGVPQRRVLGQDELVGQLPGVPGGDRLQGVAGVLLEGGDEVIGHGEGVVGDDGDGAAGRARAAGALGAAGRERQADGSGRGAGQQGAAGQAGVARLGVARRSGAVGWCAGDASGHGSSWMGAGRARVRRTGVRARGDSARLPSPVLTGAGSRVCGRPHSQRRCRRCGAA